MANNTPRRRVRALGAVAAAAALTLAAACGNNGSPSTSGGGGASGGPVTLTWWHNGTAEPLLSQWQKAADAYTQAHPDVKFNVQPIQNEQFTTKVPLALQSNNPPDIYFNQGGGLLATQTDSGRVADITSQTSSWIGDIKGSDGWKVEGKQYGVPVSIHVVGFFYRKDLFAKAGITDTPTTLAELNADVTKLKAAGVTPIALGGKDRWPDAFYYNYFAVRECSADTLKSGSANSDFSDPCFTKAGQDVLDFIRTNPFQPGFNGTPAQQGVGSSAGLLATGKAAMELQGDWDLSVMQGLVSDQSFKENIGWFPFPAIDGGGGDPKAALGGGDGFSCTLAHADVCADFLHYLTGETVQKSLVTSGAIPIPVNTDAASAVTDPTVKKITDYNNSASYIQTYFDIALPTAAGQALDDAAANLFAGQGGASSVPDAVKAAG